VTILLTGGAGFIGSHTAAALLGRGCDVLLLDNFSNSKPSVVSRIEEITGKTCPLVEADMADPAAVRAVFAAHEIDAVIHFAGFKAVGESVEKPLSYYENNLVSTLRLLHAMREFGVNKLVFSSSCTVYGPDNAVPYTEDLKTSATNPYGWTKVMIEQMIEDVCLAAPAFAAVSLRYFNPIGAHESGLIGEDPRGIPNNLLPYVSKVAAGELERIHIYGDDYDTPDGTAVRDYIHVMDLADGHIRAMEYLSGGRTGHYRFNLGTGKGSSVKEVIAAFEKACGRELPSVIDPRRAGDLPLVYANALLAETELGFRATRDLDAMCADAWRWQQNSENIQ
jgi:UDP-glucose 4-epimerase